MVADCPKCHRLGLEYKASRHSAMCFRLDCDFEEEVQDYEYFLDRWCRKDEVAKVSKVSMATLLHIPDFRPEAEEVFVIHTPRLKIPWPKGVTVEEALYQWRGWGDDT